MDTCPAFSGCAEQLHARTAAHAGSEVPGGWQPLVPDEACPPFDFPKVSPLKRGKPYRWVGANQLERCVEKDLRHASLPVTGHQLAGELSLAAALPGHSMSM